MFSNDDRQDCKSETSNCKTSSSANKSCPTMTQRMRGTAQCKKKPKLMTNSNQVRGEEQSQRRPD